MDAEPRDNAGFVGEVCFFSLDVELDVEKMLQAFEDEWKKVVSPFIEEEKYENSSIA